MAKTSTLGSPGIEVIEQDKSVRTVTSTSCAVMVPGFASQGPVEEINTIGDIKDFTNIYGVPTNAAERIFKNSVEVILENSAPSTRIFTSRLPYGAGEGDNVTSSYTLQAYPAIPVAKTSEAGYTKFENDLFSELFTIQNDNITATPTVAKIEMGEKVQPGTNSSFVVEGPYLLSPATNIRVVKFSDVNSKDGAVISEASHVSQGSAIIVNGKEYYVIGAGEAREVLYDVTDFATYEKFKTSTQDAFDIDINVGKIGEDPSFREYSMRYRLTELGWTESQKYNSVTVVGPIMDTSGAQETYTNYCATSVPASSSDKLVYKPKNIKYDLVLEDEIHDKVYLGSLLAKDSTLPAPGNSKDVSIQWNFNSGLEVSNEVYGKITTELVSATGGAKAFISIPLIDQNSVQHGMLNVEVEYAELPSGESVQGSIDKWHFYFLGEMALEKNSAYSILPNSFISDTVKDISYLIGAPVSFNISAEDYNNIITGEAFDWSDNPSALWSNDNYKLYENIKNAAFIVINKSRTNVNESHEGYFIGMSDNMFVSPSDEYVYDAIKSVKTTTKITQNAVDMKETVGIVSDDYDSVNEKRLNFALDSNHQGSISRILENNVSSFDTSGTDFDDTLSIGLFKLNKASTAQDALKLSYTLRESYNASLGADRLRSSASSTKAVSNFIETVTEASPNMTVLVNPFLSSAIRTDADGNLVGKVRVFNDKLLDNLKKFEKKYIVNTFNKSKTTSSYDSAIAPYRLAESCIKSYASMMNQAGVDVETLNLIKNNDAYKNFAMSQSLWQFGTYQTSSSSARQIIGNIPAKLRRVREILANDEEYPNMDIFIDAGLSTIYAYSNGPSILGEAGALVHQGENSTSGLEDEDGLAHQMNFIDSLILTGIEDLRTGQSSLSDEAQRVVEDYMAVQNEFLAICNAQSAGGRGDCFYISDILRGILIKGKDTKVAKLFGSTLNNSVYSSSDNVKHSWSTSMYYPIKHSTAGITSNYCASYAQWVKRLDIDSGIKFWMPASPCIAALMAATDAADGPWTAAAGVNRGVIKGILDYAYSPTLSQRSDLYSICVNSVPFVPNVGLTVMGIRTMGRKDSAFDQITCRRTFLYMEKAIKRYLRNYIFEKNTTATRLSVVNDIEPFMESVKNSDGIYNFSVTCDNTNNTPEIINNGDMAVDVAAAPTRTAENIILTMTANRYTNTVSIQSTEQ